MSVCHRTLYMDARLYNIWRMVAVNGEPPISILLHYTPSGIGGALQGESMQNCCPTLGHFTKYTSTL